jgi:hypothetical protein
MPIEIIITCSLIIIFSHEWGRMGASTQNPLRNIDPSPPLPPVFLETAKDQGWLGTSKGLKA